MSNRFDFRIQTKTIPKGQPLKYLLTFYERQPICDGGKAVTEKPSKADVFKALTWNDIEAWAGKTIVSRGRSYQRSHQVRGIACTSTGGIVAWVQGTKRYATLVDIEKGNLISACTCPYGDTCKHAVAVVLEYLECLKQNIEVPTVTEQDERLVLLRDNEEEDEVEDEPRRGGNCK